MDRTYMGVMMLRLFCILLSVAVAGSAAAKSRQDLSVFFFGNSLINHGSGKHGVRTDETTVPHWLSQLAVAGGKKFAADGTFGDEKLWSSQLSPIADWHFKQVKGVTGHRQRVSFAKAPYNTIVINTLNFIQYEPPDHIFKNDKASRVSLAVKLLKWLQQQKPGMSYFIYDGWPDLGAFLEPSGGRLRWVNPGFPPSDANFGKYHTYTRTIYNDWFVKYFELVKAGVPDIKLERIPVATVLSRLLTDTELSKIDVRELYYDSAPHGTPMIYLLAAMITYTKMYHDKVPAKIALPDTVHPLVKANYAKIADIICEEVGCP